VITADLTEFVRAGSRFACVYADPAWRYGNQGSRAATDNHYETMPVEDIGALPVRDIAADDAHLHLWTTNAFLFDAQRVMEAWGFAYKSCFVWVKPQMGMGNYWRVSHEFLLLGIRGDCPFLAHNEPSWRSLQRHRHSTKPDAIRQIIEKVSPGPRIELFARDSYPGWSAWGNQTKLVTSLFTPQGGA
jgi:N6-adenosine-specific RNA methylase IME4